MLWHGFRLLTWQLPPLQVTPHLCPCTADLKRWVAQAPAEWPDVAFFLNAGDNSACGLVCGWACGLACGRVCRCWYGVAQRGVLPQRRGQQRVWVSVGVGMWVSVWASLWAGMKALVWSGSALFSSSTLGTTAHGVWLSCSVRVG